MCVFCFFKQKTAYECDCCDWSSDVCSSDLASRVTQQKAHLSDSQLTTSRQHSEICAYQSVTHGRRWRDVESREGARNPKPTLPQLLLSPCTGFLKSG